ncbi:MAG: nucleotidyltransferase domain-containing protein [Brevinematia bacterium]
MPPNIRLTEEQIKIIKKVATEIFGEDVKVVLFGSRTDINKKGGDIDLYLITNQKDNLFKKELSFRTKLQLLLGEQKIDVIIQSDTSRDIEQTALKNGVEL